MYVHPPLNEGSGVTPDLVVKSKYVEPLDISDLNGYIYNGQCFFCSSGSNVEEEFYDGDDDWDSHYQLYKDGMDAGMDGGWGGGRDGEFYHDGDEGSRDAFDRNHDSEGIAAPINVHDNQSDS
nr:hypothetical protein CFP56_08541 [Quercus suber]